MKKMNEFPGAAAKHTAGNTSQTGTNVLDRTLKNTPANEPQLRGTMESLEVFQRHNMAMVPVDVLKSAFESSGVVFYDETGQVV